MASIFASISSSLVSYMIRDRLDNEEAIKHVSCPCLLIHGIRDTLVPFWHSKRLQ